MDTKVSVGITIFFILGAVLAGCFVFNPLNFNISPVNNYMVGNVNQTVNNTITNNDIFPLTGQFTFIPFLSGGYSQSTSTPTSGPSPGPTPDPMDHIISLFDAYVKGLFPQTGIPGAAVVIVQNNEIIYMNCFGVKDLTTQALVGPNTLFEIGSTTKQFAATNIAQLVDAGLMSWDDPITKYYPDKNEFQLYSDDVTDNIIIRDCLLHCSGLPTFGGDSNLQTFNYSYEFGLHQLRLLENSTEFRSTWQYNNMLYALPSYCAARKTNTNWNELIKEMLLEPLGMTFATTTYNDFLNSPDHVTPYRNVSGILTQFHMAGLDKLGPSGSLACSINEIANWLRFQIADTGMFNGQQVVSKTNLDETRKGQMDLVSGGKYGFGWMVNNVTIWHNGDTLSSGSYLEVIPSMGLAIAVFSTGGKYGYAFNNAVGDKFNLLLKGNEIVDPWPYEKLIAEALNKPLLDPPTSPIVDPLPFGNYTGVYYNDFFGNLNITTNNVNLICYYGNNSQPYDLKHWNGNVFEDQTNNYAFNFTDIHNGTAHQLTLQCDPPSPSVFNCTTNST